MLSPILATQVGVFGKSPPPLRGAIAESPPPPAAVAADSEFYQSYQKSVLQSRKPFALGKGFLDPAIEVHRVSCPTWTPSGHLLDTFWTLLDTFWTPSGHPLDTQTLVVLVFRHVRSLKPRSDGQDKRRWLDAGAGTCGTMEYLSSKGFEVHGVELSPSNNSVCDGFLAEQRLLAAPLHRIPFPNNTFDLVWSSEVRACREGCA
eukprot:1397277-Pyramimonas_sp.AAC.1